MEFRKLNKLRRGDKVAILSPSFAAPGRWPDVYDLGCRRLRDIFGLVPVEFPATKKLGASKEERARDLVSAFEDKEIKAVIASIGGNDQVTYIKNLPVAPFIENPKPFFGFSDNIHFENFLWLNGVPSYYGGCLFTQFATFGKMDPYTIEYQNHAFFTEEECELRASGSWNDVSLDWNDPASFEKELFYEKNDGWYWDGTQSAEGIAWGGCLESIDELLRHGIALPTLDDFRNIVLFTETSEEIPAAEQVFRVYRAFGERGILEKIKAVIVGRPKGWDFGKRFSPEERSEYRKIQRNTTLQAIRAYNPYIPVIQNFDIGHTNPQIPLPQGRRIRIDAEHRRIFADF
jgi:muramoyltetrapeptide carboxypeptidase LdcA involved in peptidoglycan recycling